VRPRILFSILALCATSTVAAQGERNFRVALQMGITGGGDTLASVRLSSGETEKIKAGGLVHLAAGLLWQPSQLPLGIQATAGYHVDNVTARNGELRFSRYPIEVLALFTGVPNLRLGTGVRYVNSPSLKIDIDGSPSTNVDFKNTIGVVAEIGYRFASRAWVALRGTFEEYETKSVNGASVGTTPKTSGDSIGVYVGFAF